MKEEPEQQNDRARGWDSTGEPDDLPEQAVQASRTQVRLNALALLAVLLLTTLAPYPWGLLAPLLFAIPLGYMLARRVGAAGRAAPPREPFSSIPKDPQDPRRYRPIG